MMRLWVRLALIAVGMWLAAAIVTAATTDRFVVTVTQLLVLGFVVFAASVASGSSLGVALATVPLLGGALIQIVAVPEQSWVRAITIGCLLYVATELGWESIDCRDGHRRSSAVFLQRFQEVATVIIASLVVAAVSLVLADKGPQRTLFLQVLMLGVAALALLATVRQLGRSQQPH